MHKYLQLDNFFSDPDSIRTLALQSSYRPRQSHEYFEGLRSPQIYTIDHGLHTSICNRILIEYYGSSARGVKYTASTFFHKTQASDRMDTQWLNDRVHRDRAIIAGIVYLTPNAPVGIGTQTYTEDTGQPDIVMGNRYNRLVVYPANCLHSAMDLGDDRLTVLFFLEAIEA